MRMVRASGLGNVISRELVGWKLSGEIPVGDDGWLGDWLLEATFDPNLVDQLKAVVEPGCRTGVRPARRRQGGARIVGSTGDSQAWNHGLDSIRRRYPDTFFLRASAGIDIDPMYIRMAEGESQDIEQDPIEFADSYREVRVLVNVHIDIRCAPP